ncbi:MAG: hypothetical protein ACXWAT_13415 [Methylobacter sp.]
MSIPGPRISIVQPYTRFDFRLARIEAPCIVGIIEKLPDVWEYRRKYVFELFCTINHVRFRIDQTSRLYYAIKSAPSNVISQATVALELVFPIKLVSGCIMRKVRMSQLVLHNRGIFLAIH